MQIAVGYHGQEEWKDGLSLERLAKFSLYSEAKGEHQRFPNRGVYRSLFKS
jgi:hypothetical protein